MNDTRPPVPVELLSLRSATSTYLDILRDIETFAEQAADVCRLIDPDYAGKLDELRAQLRDAQLNGCIGSPAAIQLALAELVGEA